MKGNLKPLNLLLTAFLFAAVSCGSTKLTSVWKDNSFNRPMNTVFVLGISDKQTSRRVFEDEFVKQLSAYGVNATQSYKEFPSEDILDKQVIESRMNELNIETLLITNIVDQKQKTHRETWYPTYSHYHRTWHGEARSVEYTEDIYHLEIKLYDVKSEGLIWSALSKTVIVDDAIASTSAKEVKKFIGLVVKQLSDDGLVTK